ncbi:bifunctional phosphoribosylaminoimidazolecarboxamide formyltransferase/IMP cyclohydrolase [Desulfurobacterium atlanticum]|uniref:Bifunctional purine biosynthesis protein PurH n=1 Tax=Desulfurobacterium atlanticum TaxID=240169 RepID=A0A239AB74_9BACT|nr:bifunctional phosphoribosylaminoimidazolecarboxamide formyltransferase/IMP cyclohydrolase [Desulfurobacterium atlanticum]SNR92308.1 phosphoribosylaminoimidazolecarboxamide formyltransferase / IMP cyclohydrolase [Desulfurobacterium atlanticum]
MKPVRALISVSDKTGVVDFAKSLYNLGIEIISTGGTARLLKENGVPVKEISELTEFPEIMEGRIKTLHPKVHGGILSKRDNPEHIETMEDLGIKPIDIVVVNLYPFKETVKSEKSFEEIIENIDIGGPTMVRAAAKNFKYVTIVTDPSDYKKIIEELEQTGKISLKTRFYLAKKAFNLTAHYDAVITDYLFKVNENGEFLTEPPEMRNPLTITFEKVQDLRYGENPHQRGAFYKEIFIDEPCISTAKKIHGEKELSFNNIYDIDGALNLVLEFDPNKEKVCAIIKHANPCGIAIGNSASDAYEKALKVDPVSAFGGIIAFNCPVDENTAKLITERFYECIIAPDYSEEALDILKTKKNLRVLKLDSMDKLINKGETSPFDYRKVVGGMLVQDRDLITLDPEKLKVVTEREPNENEWEDLLFAFKVVKWVKSNSVVYAKDGIAIGIGVGQTSRVDAAKCAAKKAKEMGLEMEGCVLASEAFFPFRDSVDEAAKVGVKAIIQPGGSIRDEEVIEAANEHNIAMVFTGIRHFRH